MAFFATCPKFLLNLPPLLLQRVWQRQRMSNDTCRTPDYIIRQKCLQQLHCLGLWDCRQARSRSQLNWRFLETPQAGSTSSDYYARARGMGADPQSGQRCEFPLQLTGPRITGPLVLTQTSSPLKRQLPMTNWFDTKYLVVIQRSMNNI